MNYYNTTKQTGDSLRRVQQKTMIQSDRVLMFFEDNALLSMSPSQVHSMVFADKENVPLTSVRRAISDLTNAGKLTKLNRYTSGLYGTKEHLWRLTLGETERKTMNISKKSKAMDIFELPIVGPQLLLATTVAKAAVFMDRARAICSTKADRLKKARALNQHKIDFMYSLEEMGLDGLSIFDETPGRKGA